MFGLFSSSKPRAVRSTVGYTMTTVVQVHGREIEQVQHATEHYVATLAAGKVILFRPELGARFVVDPSTRELKRLDLSAQAAQARQIAPLLQGSSTVVDPEEVEVDGFRCRRVTYQVETPQLVISSETFRTRVPGLERTALSAERAMDDATQPIPSGLDPDEIVVRSRVHFLAAGVGQNQEVRLVSLSEGVDALAEMDALLAYRIAD